MREILNRSNPFELNAIFIQPSRYCKLDCKGCYVKEHTGGEDSYHMSIELWRDLFQTYLYDIHDDHHYHTNQITFSADDYSKDPIKKQYMKKVFEEYFFYICAGKAKYDKSLLPEAHITFHTLNTFDSYRDELGLSYNNKSFATIFDMISFSEIKLSELDTIKELAQYTKINYNHLIPNRINNLRDYIDKINQIGKVVNHIYLVINKTPIGRKQTELDKDSNAQTMFDDRYIITQILKSVDNDIKSKISVDGCLKDVDKHSRTGFGCSSNVSRIQIWPDGSVTGCAYAFNSTGTEARSFAGLLENISRARGQYDFRDRCHLPDAYKDSKSGRFNQTKIQNKRQLLLIID
jgi:hypothetical protein